MQSQRSANATGRPLRVGDVELTLAPGDSAMESDSTQYDMYSKLCALYFTQTCKAPMPSSDLLSDPPSAPRPTVDGANPALRSFTTRAADATHPQWLPAGNRLLFLRN